MELDALISVDYSKYSCQFIINGLPIPIDYQLIAMELHRGYQCIGQVRATFKVDVNINDPLLINPLTQLKAGMPLQIKATDGIEDILLMEAVVIEHRFKSSINGARLIILAKDAAIQMAYTCYTETFASLSDKEILEGLVQKAGLTFKENNTLGKFLAKNTQTIKHGLSDWDFANIKAEANGCYIYTVDKEVVVEQPKLAVVPTEIVEISYGTNVFDLDISHDDRFSQTRKKIDSWDTSEQALVTSEEQEGLELPDPILKNLVSEKTLVNHDINNETNIEEYLKAFTQQKALAQKNGKVEIAPRLNAKPGMTAKISGYNELIDGQYIISQVLHSFSEGVFSTSLQLGLGEESFEEKYQISQMAASTEIVAATVTQLEGDPDSLNRIQIKIGAWGRAQEPIWARYSNIYAGNGHGFCFLPEVGDEVLVAIGGMYSTPSIIGSTFSAKYPSHTTPADDNYQKVLLTKKGMKWAWNDEKAEHEISTPAGNKILMTEDGKTILIEDQNGNKIEMTNAAISLEGMKDIKIKATANLILEGNNIEVKSTGNATIKGAMVMIN